MSQLSSQHTTPQAGPRAAGPTGPVTTAEPRLSYTTESTLQQLQLPARSTISRSTLEQNLPLAQRQSWWQGAAALVIFNMRALTDYLIASGLLYLTYKSVSTFGFSFAQYPLLSGWNTLCALFAVSRIPFGVNKTVRGFRARSQSKAADKITTSDDFEAANKLSQSPAATNAELETAANLYLKFTTDTHGVRLTTQSLLGFRDCITRLGVSPEAALLMSRVGQTVSDAYRRLPVQKELFDIAIDAAPQMFALLPDQETRLELSDSIRALAVAAAEGEHSAELKAAERLLHLARSIPEDYALIRAGILSTALDLTKKNDPLRENIEAQLQEISDRYRHQPTIPLRARKEMQQIFTQARIF